MKAEEKTVAFMFFSVVMQFVYSLGGGGGEQKQQQHEKKKKKKNRIWGWGKGVERDQRRGIGGPNSSGRQQGTPVKIIEGGLILYIHAIPHTVR